MKMDFYHLFPQRKSTILVISFSKILLFTTCLDFLLRDRLFRQQHVCSNMLTPEEAPETEGQRGFLDSYDAARVPSMSGFDRPHQVDSQ